MDTSTERPFPAERATHGGSRHAVMVLLLLALCAHCYAIHCGYIWDDPQYVVDNLTLRSAAGLKQIWIQFGATPQYYPLVFTTFWLEYHIWGLHPAGYHVVNILLHAGAVVLLWFVLRRLNIPGAWFAAALFAVHPVHVESVAWITERKNVLSAVFYLASLLALLRFDNDAHAKTRNARWFWIGLFLYILALLSKTVACSLPAAYLVILWWQARLSWRRVAWLLPFFAIGLGMAMITVWMETESVGASGEEWAFTFFERCLIAGRALWFYMGKLLWPATLIFIYPRWTIDSGNPVQWLYAVGFLALVALFWMRRRQWGRGPTAALLIFAGTLTPALGFIDIYPMRYSFVADHFQYLASAAFLTLVAAFVFTRLVPSDLAVWSPGMPGPRSASARIRLLCLCALPLSLLLLLSNLQTRAYMNSESLWRDTLSKNTGAWIAHNNMGLILAERREYPDAIFHYREAIQLNPKNAHPQSNLGAALMDTGKLDEAESYLVQASNLSPTYFFIWNNLGNLYAKQGRLEESLSAYKKAVRLNDRDPTALINIGNLYAEQGNYALAERLYTSAVRMRPDLAVAHYHWGNAMMRKGDWAEALVHLQDVLRLRPDHAPTLYRAGECSEALGEDRDAMMFYWMAINNQTGFIDAHYLLALTFIRIGNLDQATVQLRSLLIHDPKHTDAMLHLAETYTHLAKFDLALRWYNKAIAERPDLIEARVGLGKLYIGRGDVDSAESVCAAALEVLPDTAAAHTMIAELFLMLDKDADGIDHYRKALELQPDNGEVLRKLAWLLATGDTVTQESGLEAVKLAEAAAAAMPKSPELLDIAAAAYAAAGRYAEAAATVTEAIQMAEAEKRTDLVKALNNRLTLYEEGQRFILGGDK